MSVTHTITTREFSRNASGVKHLAQDGPVFVTDHGKPSLVVLKIGDYRGWPAARARCRCWR